MSACAATSGKVEVWKPPLQCSGAVVDPEAAVMSSESMMRAQMSSPLFSVVGDKPTPKVEMPADRTVVRITMGRQRTSGYRLELVSPEVVFEDGVGRVRVNWIFPPADAMLAQVITYPCLYLSLPSDGYSALEIVDQAEAIRHRIEFDSK